MLLMKMLATTTSLLALLATTAAQINSDILHLKVYRPSPLDARGPPGTLYLNGTFLYLPSPPGTRPPCAREGETFCTETPQYPREILGKLLKNWKFDLASLFVSETDEKLTFPGARRRQVPTSRPRLSTNRSVALIFPTNQRPPDITFTGAARPPHFSPAFTGAPARSSRRRPISVGRQLPTANQRTRNISTANQRTRNIPFTGAPAANQPARNISFTGAPAPPPLSYLPPPRATPWGWSAFPAAAGSKFHLRRRRQLGDSAGTKLCPTTGQFIQPKVGLNSQGEWRFLVNSLSGQQDGKFTQLVRTERCLTEECNGLCTIPLGMSATCQQQFVQKKMICLDPSGTKMYTDLFWLPSCCVCEIS